MFELSPAPAAASDCDLCAADPWSGPTDWEPSEAAADSAVRGGDAHCVELLHVDTTEAGCGSEPHVWEGWHVLCVHSEHRVV